MAESVTILARCLTALGGLLFLLGAAAQTAAPENLLDPTRPPAALAATGESAAAVVAGPVLQSVLISPGRKVAVISGQTVQVGEKFGEARVAGIAEGEVVLVRDGQSQTLKLFPGIEKRRTRSAPGAKVHSRRQ